MSANATAAADRCQAVTSSYRRQSRCTSKAVGSFQRTRTTYHSEPDYDKGVWVRVPTTETQQLGRLCRRHANLFSAEEVPA